MVKLQLKDVASVKKAVVKDMVMAIVIMRRIVQGESEDDGIDVERFTYSEVGLIQYIYIRK